MIRFNLALFAFSAAATLLPAAEPSFAPATIKTAAELAATVKQNLAKNPDQADAPVVNTDRYRINVVRRGKEGVAMAHAAGPAKGTEVHYIVDGAATVVLTDGDADPHKRGGPMARGVTSITRAGKRGTLPRVMWW